MEPLHVGLACAVAALTIGALVWFLRPRENPLKDGRAYWFAFGALGLDVPDIGGVVGLLMDINVGGQRSAIVAMADGSASSYWNTGAVIGGGDHESIAAKRRSLSNWQQKHTDLFRLAPDRNQPTSGNIRIFARTRNETLFVEANGTVDPNDQSPVTQMMLAGNEVITAIAEYLESQQARNRR